MFGFMGPFTASYEESSQFGPRRQKWVVGDEVVTVTSPSHNEETEAQKNAWMLAAMNRAQQNMDAQPRKVGFKRHEPLSFRPGLINLVAQLMETG